MTTEIDLDRVGCVSLLETKIAFRIVFHEKSRLRETGAGERRPASAGGMGEARSALGLRRLEAPVRDKPGIDQHQRRALRPELRDIGNDSTKRSDAWRLCVTKRRLNRSERWPRADPGIAAWYYVCG